MTRFLARRFPWPHPRWLAVLLTVAGVSHFVTPDPYRRIVPRGLGDPGAWVVASGAAELVGAALLVKPATRRIGGWFTAALLVALFPANVQMALDGGLAGRGFPLGSGVVAWLRLPLQVPLVMWALSVARRERGRDDPRRSAPGSAATSSR